MKQFSQEILDKIKRALEEEKKVNPHPIAAFDADGTLWYNDFGEGFFRYQIANNLFPEVLKKFPDPWRHYRTWKSQGDERPALMWLAQVNAGFSLSQVREWASDFAASIEPVPFFPEVKSLIAWLLAEKVKIYIVTASIKWSVEPGAERLHIPEPYVLGFRTEVHEGVISDKPTGAMTFREGKAEGLLEATGGKKPFLACGNSMGDEFLLKAATRLRLAVRSHPEGHELFPTEDNLSKLAEREGWLTYRLKSM